LVPDPAHNLPLCLGVEVEVVVKKR
jgi:hypothetical protein